jgi:hypothetical protein
MLVTRYRCSGVKGTVVQSDVQSCTVCYSAGVVCYIVQLVHTVIIHSTTRSSRSCSVSWAPCRLCHALVAVASFGVVLGSPR